MKKYNIRTEQPRDFKIVENRRRRPEQRRTILLSKELDEGFLDGVTGSYKDPEGYFVTERMPEEFEKYEASFPPKEKLVLPGQL